MKIQYFFEWEGDEFVLIEVVLIQPIGEYK